MKGKVKIVFYVAWIVQLLCQSCNYRGTKKNIVPRAEIIPRSTRERPIAATTKIEPPEFHADIESGRIGVSRAGESDRAYDNIFHVTLSR